LRRVPLSAHASCRLPRSTSARRLSARIRQRDLQHVELDGHDAVRVRYREMRALVLATIATTGTASLVGDRASGSTRPHGLAAIPERRVVIPGCSSRSSRRQRLVQRDDRGAGRALDHRELLGDAF